MEVLVYSISFVKRVTTIRPACDSDISMTENKIQIFGNMRCLWCPVRGHRCEDCKRNVVCTYFKGRHAPNMRDPFYVKEAELREQNQKGMLIYVFPLPRCSERTITRPAFIYKRSGHVRDEHWEVMGLSSRYDAGWSHRTFIKAEITEGLHAAVVRKTRILENTFSTNTTTECDSNVTNVRLRSRHDDSECTIEVFTIPVIFKNMKIVTHI